MTGYEPDEEKENPSVRDAQGEDLIASRIYQAIWEAHGEAACTFDIQLKAAGERRNRMQGFNHSIDFGKVS